MNRTSNFRIRLDGRKSKAFEDQAAAQGGIAKHVYDASDNLEKSTYYVLDAQGKKKRELLKTKGQQTLERQPQGTISVYDREVDNTLASITYELKEQHIYGSSRLGLLNKKEAMLGSQNTTYSQDEWQYSIGDRSYEISNHLGNVLSVISDKPIPHVNGTNIDYYLADLRMSQDYSPFGVTLEGRGGAVTPPGRQVLWNFIFKLHFPKRANFNNIFKLEVVKHCFQASHFSLDTSWLQ